MLDGGVSDLYQAMKYLYHESTGNPKSNSLAYRVMEIETHLHSGERWFEDAGVPAAGTHEADRIGTVGGGGPFQIDAGNNTWGSWVQILGSDDTPADTGKTHFDLHRISIVTTERNNTYFIQIGCDTTAADSLTNGTYTEFVYEPITTKDENAPLPVQTKRATAGTKAWARCMCPGQNTATLDFYFGLHEYDR